MGRGAALLLAGLLGAGIAAAQSLNWDGQTGVFITPLAYTAASPASGFGHPIVAYHFLNAGPVLGNFHTISVTEGVGGRVEFGYTRDLHQQGSTAGLSPLWDSGFNLVHAKVNVVKENAGKQSWLPAISGGFVARTQDRNVSGLLVTPHKSYSNADFYLVAHLKETFPQLRRGRPMEINGAMCEAVSASKPGQPPVNFYFDQKTGLLQRMVRYAETPMGRMPTQIDYADYRETDGVKIPWRWTLARTNGRFTIQLKEVKNNVAIDDSKFTKPEGEVK